MLLQTIFYPFAMYSSRRDGTALLPSVKGPAYDSPSYGRVNTIDTSAILGDGVLHTFLVNRNIRATAEIEIDPGRGKLVSVMSAEVVSGPGPDVRNTYENPNAICSQPLQTVKISEEKRVSSFRRSRLPPSPLELPDCLPNDYQNHTSATLSPLCSAERSNPCPEHFVTLFCQAFILTPQSVGWARTITW